MARPPSRPRPPGHSRPERRTRPGGKPGARAGGKPGPGGRRRKEEPRPKPRPKPKATVLLATHNRGKLQEILDRLRDLPIYFQMLDELGELPVPVEDASTFDANARKKALHYTRYTDHLVLAEDSGLMVDALDGAPGVRSARFAGAGATDADRMRLLLTKMDGVRWDYRTARFVCAAAIARGGKVLASFEGMAEGRIALEPTGSAGFGYDPVFVHEGTGRTYAEMERADKARVSHRGKTLDQLEAWFRSHLGPAPTAGRRPPRARA